MQGSEELLRLIVKRTNFAVVVGKDSTFPRAFTGGRFAVGELLANECFVHRTGLL